MRKNFLRIYSFTNMSMNFLSGLVMLFSGTARSLLFT